MRRLEDKWTVSGVTNGWQVARHSRYDTIAKYVLATTTVQDMGTSFLVQNITYVKGPAKPSEYKVL
jgi:hypothetical protein